MNGWTLAPALGWPAGGAIAVLMGALAVTGVVLHVRRRHASDETAVACVRRAVLCVTVALMALTPAVRTTTTGLAVSTTDVVVALDVTGSMAVGDAAYGDGDKMTRLDAARRVVDDLTGLYPDSSFAAVRFGASGTLDVPLTPDTGAVRSWAETLRPEATGASDGSTLDAPLDRLTLTLRDIHERHPDDRIVLYLISDGEQTSDRTRRTFSALRRYLAGAVVVGVGSPDGGQVPTVDADGTVRDGQWVTDPGTGKPAVSRLDAATLRAVADEMGGTYLQASAGTTVQRAASPDSGDGWRMTTTARTRTRVEPVVWPLAALAAALLAWEAGALIGSSRRLL